MKVKNYFQFNGSANLFVYHKSFQTRKFLKISTIPLQHPLNFALYLIFAKKYGNNINKTIL
jgi:hypothetical protein